MTTTALADAPPAAPARWREWMPSLALAAVVGAFLLVTPRVTDYVSGPGGAHSYSMSVGFDAFAVIAGVMVVVGVVIGRRWPVQATALIAVPLLAILWTGSFTWGWWLGLVAVAILAALDRLRRAIVPTVAALLVAAWFCGTEMPASVPGGAVTSGTGLGYEWVALVIYTFWVVAVVIVAAAIGAARRSRHRAADAKATEQHALEVESLAGERARLARDLHDVVAHHVSLVAVRAESAPFVHPDLGDDAREVLAAIATDAREALTELRQVLVVLQRTSDEGERAPQPSAGDVDDLVTSAVAAGQPVALTGEWRDVPPATGYVLYRAVQEGLTNARRHAPGSATTLVRTQTDDEVGFRMTNPAQSAAKPGRGLIGMRERVEALGGTMTAVVDDGEFVLDVAVPA